jgi:hypothetical protein
MKEPKRLKELRLSNQEILSRDKKMMSRVTIGGKIGCYACGLGNVDKFEFAVDMWIAQSCDPVTV